MKDNANAVRSHRLKVQCTPAEKTQIEANARDAGLSVSTYLRNIGMGYTVTGIIDAEVVGQLAKINGDQGRLGGLLKLWPNNSEKLGKEDPEKLRRVIHGVLDRIVTSQDVLLSVAREASEKSSR